MAYKYKKTREGIFISRPNRFIAEVDIDGVTERCHVKNTGRCKELLPSGARVILSEGDNPNRKTKYDLIAVYKNGMLINMDSQVPNKCAEELLPRIVDGLTLVKPEYTYGASRLDFYAETAADKILIEVKGVTLEENGVVRFPDAPTERGIKHLRELTAAVQKGYKAYLLFIIQMKGVKYLEPNRDTHPEFAAALSEAAAGGVNILAYDCIVTEDSIEAADRVDVHL